MKLALVLSFISVVASAQSVQQQAAQLTAPATQSGFKNEGATRMLEELEREEQASAHPADAAPPVAPAAPVAVKNTEPPKPRDTHFVSHAVTTRYLFLKISDSLLRFHVDANLGDDELETVVRALGSSCLKSAVDDAACDSAKQNSILVDKAFLADAKLSQIEHWSHENTPKGQLWKLVCASGGDECFDRLNKVRSFKLTANRKAADGRILAHGFESQAVRAIAKKRRAPASVVQQRTLDRVYVTRTTSEKIKLLPKGTL
jgi:hypothetical protein